MLKCNSDHSVNMQNDESARALVDQNDRLKAYIVRAI